MNDMNGTPVKPIAEMETVMGTLSVLPWESDCFPGFIVRLTLPDGTEYEPACVEVNQCNKRHPTLRINVWEPGTPITGDPDSCTDYTPDEIVDALTAEGE